jgi:hypothetical protein
MQSDDRANCANAFWIIIFCPPKGGGTCPAMTTRGFKAMNDAEIMRSAVLWHGLPPREMSFRLWHGLLAYELPHRTSASGRCHISA